MFNLIQGLSPTQFIFVGIGFVLVFISIKDYIFSVLNIEVQDEDNNEKEEDKEETSLTTIVSKWEDLTDACKDAGLSDAYNKLQEVFPMLIKAYQPEVVKKDEK
jgi:hypothetical protein